MTLWHAIVRWDRPGVARLRLRIPCSCPARARWLRRMLGYGNVQKGTIEATGIAIARILRRLGFEEDLVEMVNNYLAELPGQGLPNSWEQKRRQIAALDTLFAELYGTRQHPEARVAEMARARLSVARTSGDGQSL